MNTSSNKRKFVLGICYVVSSFLLSACGATEYTPEVPECRSATPDNCEVQDGEDRSYDPCLINKNLPVCQS